MDNTCKKGCNVCKNFGKKYPLGCHIVIDELGCKLKDKTLPNFEAIEGLIVIMEDAAAGNSPFDADEVFGKCMTI